MSAIALDTYQIEIGPLHLGLINNLRARGYQGYAILVDDHTNVHCLPHLLPLLADLEPTIIRIPAGEQHKQLGTCQRIWDALFAAKATRRWCLLNLGGGVVGDMGGFCAGTYKRGIDFVQIPTTLLSQVDASVGGKLGIDYGGIKNSIGLFRDPVGVWIDPAFLRTLPARELRSGFAEVIKHALIADRAQWEQLTRVEQLSEFDWVTLIRESVLIKQRIVRADPFERGLRKALNFGHTVGHALESYWLSSADPLLHGEAIAIGIIAESWLSSRQTGLESAELESIGRFVLRHFGHRAIPLDAFTELLARMQQDKKNETTDINFSLLTDVGEVTVNQTAPPEHIRASLEFYNSLG